MKSGKKKPGYKKIELTPVQEYDEEDTIHYQAESNTLINSKSPMPQYIDSSDSDSLDENLESYLASGQPISNFSVSIGSRRTNKRRRRRDRHYIDDELGDLDPNIETNDVLGEILTNPRFYFCLAILSFIAIFLIVMFSIYTDHSTTIKVSNSDKLIEKLHHMKYQKKDLDPPHKQQIIRHKQTAKSIPIEVTLLSQTTEFNIFKEDNIEKKLDYVYTLQSMRNLVGNDEATCFYQLNRYTILYGTVSGQIWIMNLNDDVKNPKQGNAKLLNYLVVGVEIEQLSVDFKGRVVFVDKDGYLHLLQENNVQTKLNKISRRNIEGQWFEINRKRNIVYFWSMDKQMNYFTQLNLDSGNFQQQIELEFIKTPMPNFTTAVFSIELLKKRVIFIHKQKGIYTKDLKQELFKTQIEQENHEINSKPSKKKSPVRFKGRTNKLQFDIVAVDSYLTHLIMIKKIFNLDKHSYIYSIQYFQEKNNFYYLQDEQNLKKLILYPLEMIFEGKMSIVGRLQQNPIFMLSFKHMVEDLEYIYTFQISKGKLEVIKVNTVDQIFDMTWQDYLLSMYPKNRVEFGTTVMGCQKNGYDTDLWMQKIGQDQTKSFFDRFHYDWLNNIQSMHHIVGSDTLLLGSMFGDIFSYSFKNRKISTELSMRGRIKEIQMKFQQAIWMAKDYRNNIVLVQRNMDVIILVKKGLKVNIQYLLQDVYHYVEKVIFKLSRDKKYLMILTNEMPEVIKIINLETKQIIDQTLKGMEVYKNKITDFDIFFSNDQSEEINLQSINLYALYEENKKQKVLSWSYGDHLSFPKIELFDILSDKQTGLKMRVTPLKSISVNKSGTFLAINGSKRIAIASIQHGILKFLADEENREKIDYVGDKVDLEFITDKEQYLEAVGDTNDLVKVYTDSKVIIAFKMFLRAKGDYEVHYLSLNNTKTQTDYTITEIKKVVYTIDEFWENL